MALNRWIGIGRLTKTPELSATPSGVAFCRFTVAVNRKYSKDRERETDFITVVAWRGTAEFICRYFEKGSPIQIEGRIQTDRYKDRDGNDRTSFEVVADEASFVEGAAKATGETKPQSRDDSEPDFEPVVGEDTRFPWEIG